MSRQVKLWEAVDGTYHKTKDAADAVERWQTIRQEFDDWYDENSLDGPHVGCRVDSEDMLAWLMENNEEVGAFLDGYKEVSITGVSVK